jgi:hypothetical protein
MRIDDGCGSLIEMANCRIAGSEYQLRIDVNLIVCQARLQLDGINPVFHCCDLCQSPLRFGLFWSILPGQWQRWNLIVAETADIRKARTTLRDN